MIGGWAKSDKGRGFASLLLGVREGGTLVYRGRVGTGFSQRDLDAIGGKLEALRTDKPPFAGKLSADARRGAVWVRPELVAEVAFAEITADGNVRHASFLGLREDKAATDVVAETPVAPPAASPLKAAGKLVAQGIAVTNPDRVIFPEIGLTKRELVTYYEAVGELMLRDTAGRPLSLVRCPQGRGKACFFQKHDTGMFPPGLHTADVPWKERTEQVMTVTDLQGIIGCVQMNTLEFHGWGSRLATLEQADRLVFDLDPDEGLGFEHVKTAAHDLRALLQELGLQSWPLLSGGKGVHVVVPLTPGAEWPAVKAFAKGFADACAQREPQRFTSALAKAKRVGRIFIDYLRNQRGATAILPYSTRARENAPVAVPVAWRELDGIVSGAQFTTRDAPLLLKRAKSAALKGWAAADQRLPG